MRGYFLTDETKRKLFTARVATGSYDAVIMSQQQFEKIPMSVLFSASFMRNSTHLKICCATGNAQAKARTIIRQNSSNWQKTPESQNLKTYRPEKQSKGERRLTRI